MVKNSKKLKQAKFENEDVAQIRNLIIIFVIVVLVCVGLYFLTDTMIKRESNNNDNTTQKVEIDYDIATVGTMFNRIEEEYYVLMYDFDGDYAEKGIAIYNLYTQKEDSIKMYVVDLGRSFNSGYVVSDKTQVNTNDVSTLKVMNPTLIKVKAGKAVSVFAGAEEIKKQESTLLK